MHASGFFSRENYFCDPATRHVYISDYTVLLSTNSYFRNFHLTYSAYGEEKIKSSAAEFKSVATMTKAVFSTKHLDKKTAGTFVTLTSRYSTNDVLFARRNSLKRTQRRKT